MRFFSLTIALAVLLPMATVFAQNRRTEAERSYQQLRQSFQRQAGADPQTTERERVRSVETWLQRNDWRELSVKDQAWLCDTLSEADQLDKKAFSVRWTGTLRTPVTGSYTFSQRAIPGAEGSFKLWINDQLVLDNATESVKEDDMAAVQKSKSSSVVALTAGTPVPFRLDYVRAPVIPQPGVMRLPGFPAAVLAWQSDVLEQQVIPAGVFFTPDVKPGLLGEYFSDTAFTKRVVLRTDPNIDFMWDVGRIATKQRGSQREIVSQSVTNITAPGFLNSLDPAEAEDFIREQLPVLFGTMSASERVAVLQAVSERPDLLQYLTFSQMAAALRWYSTLANPVDAVELFVKWSKTASPPKTQPGFVPGRREGGYLNLNVEPYFRLSRLFLGDNVDANIEMLSEHLANEDGTCNLTVAYVLTCICRMAEKQRVIADLIDAQLLGEEAERVPGDVRATWFQAEAFKYEAIYGRDFQPGAGIIPIERGLKDSQSLGMRFQMIGELVARLISLDRSDEAQSLIMSVRDQYPDEATQEQMDVWLAKGVELKEYYENLRAQAAEESNSFVSEEYTKELKRRAAVAEQRGEKRNLQRYQRSIATLEKRQEEREKTKKERQ